MLLTIPDIYWSKLPLQYSNVLCLLREITVEEIDKLILALKFYTSIHVGDHPTIRSNNVLCIETGTRVTMQLYIMYYRTNIRQDRKRRFVKGTL